MNPNVWLNHGFYLDHILAKPFKFFVLLSKPEVSISIITCKIAHPTSHTKIPHNKLICFKVEKLETVCGPPHILYFKYRWQGHTHSKNLSARYYDSLQDQPDSFCAFVIKY